MKTKRELSGIFFRIGKENIVFEDLESEQQDKMMEDRNDEWLKSLAKSLANTINNLGETFDLSAKIDVKESK